MVSLTTKKKLWICNIKLTTLILTLHFSPCEKRFQSFEDIKKWIDSWIASKDEEFFRNGIHKLPEKWRNIIASDGQYFQ